VNDHGLADWYVAYVEAFSDVAAGRREGIEGLAACFAPPVTLTTNDVHLVLATSDDVIASVISPQVAALRAAGFDRITFSALEARAVNARAGIVDVELTRWDTGGREISGQHACYVVVRPEEEWRIAAIAVGSQG
jgi:hypothetical protein